MTTNRTRRQWVFLNPCGCATGVLEAGSNESRSKAFRDMYETAAERNAAVDRGVTAVLVDHEQYVREFSPQMYGSWQCPHGAVAS